MPTARRAGFLSGHRGGDARLHDRRAGAHRGPGLDPAPGPTQDLRAGGRHRQVSAETPRVREQAALDGAEPAADQRCARRAAPPDLLAGPPGPQGEPIQAAQGPAPGAGAGGGGRRIPGGRAPAARLRARNREPTHRERGTRCPGRYRGVGAGKRARRPARAGEGPAEPERAALFPAQRDSEPAGSGRVRGSRARRTAGSRGRARSGDRPTRAADRRARRVAVRDDRGARVARTAPLGRLGGLGASRDRASRALRKTVRGAGPARGPAGAPAGDRFGAGDVPQPSGGPVRAPARVRGEAPRERGGAGRQRAAGQQPGARPVRARESVARGAGGARRAGTDAVRAVAPAGGGARFAAVAAEGVRAPARAPAAGEGQAGFAARGRRARGSAGLGSAGAPAGRGA